MSSKTSVKKQKNEVKASVPEQNVVHEPVQVPVKKPKSVVNKRMLKSEIKKLIASNDDEGILMDLYRALKQ